MTWRPLDEDAVVYEYDSGHKTRQSRVDQTLAIVSEAGAHGITSQELATILFPGNVSGKSAAGSPLSKLHKEGRLVALMDKRQGHHIYVVPEETHGRERWKGYQHRAHHCATCTCYEEET